LSSTAAVAVIFTPFASVCSVIPSPPQHTGITWKSPINSSVGVPNPGMSGAACACGRYDAKNDGTSGSASPVASGSSVVVAPGKSAAVYTTADPMSIG